MRVLLVWNVIPEAIYAYVIEDPTPEELRVLKATHDCYLNNIDDDKSIESLMRVNAALADDPRGFEGEQLNWVGRWTKNKVKLSAARPLQGPFDLVVLTGFIC